MAQQKKVKRARHMERLKEKRECTLQELMVGACPKFSLLSMLDQFQASDELHPKWDLKKDVILWADDSALKDAEPSGDGTISLALLTAKPNHFLLAHIIKGLMDFVHKENVLYRQNFIYRKYGRDIGLAWFQELLDELHRRSQTNEKLPPLKDHLVSFESELHNTVCLLYTSPSPRDRG